MGNPCTIVFPNTREWEQQEWNKTKRQTKKVRREAWVYIERSKAGTQERSPDGLSLPNQNTILIDIAWYWYGKSKMKFN